MGRWPTPGFGGPPDLWRHAPPGDSPAGTSPNYRHTSRNSESMSNGEVILRADIRAALPSTRTKYVGTILSYPLSYSVRGREWNRLSIN
jgi:hypothetical protein